MLIPSGKRRYVEAQNQFSTINPSLELDNQVFEPGQSVPSFDFDALNNDETINTIPDLEQTDVAIQQSIRMIFRGNYSDVNISTSEGGKAYGFWFGEYDAKVIASKSNMFELMINGKKSFHVENTLFYWYVSFPMSRGFWNLKWITPDGTKTFHLIVIHGHIFYDENSIEGSFWGMGKSGDYQIITNYLDYSRTIWGYWNDSWAFYPIFIGLDVTLP